MSFFIEKEVECNFNFDYEKVAEAVVNASLEHESFPVPAGPMPNTIIFFLIASTYSFWPMVFGFTGFPFIV